ncbi:MAG: flagellar assembly protein J [archaeon ADurb.Bin336]|nr:MAG: flagellar assembly protein J [archaeon ADurb.Bin336]
MNLENQDNKLKLLIHKLYSRLTSNTLIQKYQYWLDFGHINYPAPIWIGASILTGIFMGIISYALSTILIHEFTLIPSTFFLATIILLIGYPYLKKETLIESVEKNFSDALKQMADTLRAGDTYENALREVVEADYGRLSEEMQLALRRMEDGENLETALTGFANRVDSERIKRTVQIILDSIRTGSSLSDILNEIAEDLRDYERLKEERKASTTMQFLFLVAAGGFIAPMIFGEIGAVITGFASIGAREINMGTANNNFITTIIQLYIIIEVIGSGVMMSLINEGKINKSIIYTPILLLIAFIVYHATKIIITGMVVGSI